MPPPPEYPFVYYCVKKDKVCEHCDHVGRECHNILYGDFLAAVVARYHCEYPYTYNEHDAAGLFIDQYRVLAEFERHLDESKLGGESGKLALPECVAFDSFVFALNSVEWSIMWEINEKLLEDCDAEPATKAAKKPKK